MTDVYRQTDRQTAGALNSQGGAHSRSPQLALIRKAWAETSREGRRGVDAWWAWHVFFFSFFDSPFLADNGGEE